MIGSEFDSIDFSVKTDSLYREEEYSDMNMATIKRLVPVKPDGKEDKTRDVLFLGYTQIMTPAGSFPIQCPLEAKNFKDAIAEYPRAMREALHLVFEELRKQEAEASRIIVPEVQHGGKILF